MKKITETSRLDLDATEDGRRLKMMPIVDEYSREYLALETERFITAESLW